MHPRDSRKRALAIIDKLYHLSADITYKAFAKHWHIIPLGEGWDQVYSAQKALPATQTGLYFEES